MNVGIMTVGILIVTLFDYHLLDETKNTKPYQNSLGMWLLHNPSLVSKLGFPERYLGIDHQVASNRV